MTTSFKIEHSFSSIPLEKFELHLNDERLNQMLIDALGFDERKLLSKRIIEDDQAVEWQFLVRRSGELPAILKKVIPANTLAWIETTRFVKREHCIYWRIEPEIKSFKFHGEGVWRLAKSGKGMKRQIEGDITVDIPIIGKMAESFILGELKKTYEIEPAVQKEFHKSIA